MFKTIQQSYWFLSVFIMLVACTSEKTSIRQGETFDGVLKIAQQKNQSFCVVLTDSTQGFSREYVESLQGDYSYITNKAVFNVIDISAEESEWYIKWLTPVSLPLACVFTPDGQLIDLIPGAAKESFLYTDQAIETHEITAYHWPNRFQRNKQMIVPLLKQVNQFKQDINNENYQWKVYESLSDSLQYPYIDYLMLKAAVLRKDLVSAIGNAQRLLNTESSGTLELYKDEFIEAKKIINPNFSVLKAPSIRTDYERITLADLEIGQSVPIDIVLYNDGEEALKIEKINMSCTCVHLDGPSEGILIEGKKSYTAKFYFTPEDVGDVSRDVFISSNALNQPNLHISILANVNQ